MSAGVETLHIINFGLLGQAHSLFRKVSHDDACSTGMRFENNENGDFRRVKREGTLDK